jgi:phosphoglycerol transferase MdoB-like AlkP superfamily enzyme
MWALLKKLNRKMVFPVSWTVFTIFLLCIPGSDIPSKGFFSIEGLDKVAHIILFGGIVLFWGFWFRNNPDAGQWRRLVAWSIVLTTLLGIGLEFLQRYAIPNRSFDVGDIWADFGGAAATGFIHLFWTGIKR